MNLIDLQLDSELMQQLDANMVLRALGDRVSSNLCLWGAVKRNSNIPVRVASSRTYLYRLDMIPGWNPGADPDKLERACELFIGNHDFSAFQGLIKTERLFARWMIAGYGGDRTAM